MPDPAGVAADTAFRLTSKTGESAVSLASRLDVSPPLDVTVAPDDAGAAVISPTTSLQPNGIYRFTLLATDGSVAGSWAFRVRGPVDWLATIPGNAEQGVPVRTGIEVTFNQEDVADMASHFSISRASAVGSAARVVQVFVPETLEPATLYTVTIGPASPARTDLRSTGHRHRFGRGPEVTEPVAPPARSSVEPDRTTVLAVVALSLRDRRPGC
jgi:hypothetical protein